MLPLGTLLENLRSDVWYSFRQLRRNPSFLAFACITLAAGIGVNVAVFSIVHGTLFQAIPYSNRDRLVSIWESDPEMGYDMNAVAPAIFRAWQAGTQSFEELALFDNFFTKEFVLSKDGNPERVYGARATASLFEVLGVQPLLGRAFVQTEEDPGSSQVVVLSYNLWRRRFAGADSVLGTTISVNRRNHTIIGVMPKGFQFPGGSGTIYLAGTGYYPEAAELWVPLALEPGLWQSRTAHMFQTIGRLRAGTDIKQAQAELDRVEQRIKEQFPAEFFGKAVKVVPLRTQVVGRTGPALVTLSVSAGCLLLIACANVAHLLLMRGGSRQREVAISAALGASRARVTQQVVAEGVIVAGLAGVAGIALAYWTVPILVRFAPRDLLQVQSVGINLPVLAFALAVSLAAGIAASVLPALQASNLNLNPILQESGVVGRIGRKGRRFRTSLIVTEVSLSFVLLVGAILMIQSFIRLYDVDPGFSSRQVMTVPVQLPEAVYRDDQSRLAFFASLLERARSIPGVKSVALTSSLPLTGQETTTGVTIEGQPTNPSDKPLSPNFRVVSAGYCQTLGIPLVRGRDFTSSDTAQAPKVAILNTKAATDLFGDRDPIGRLLRVGFEQELVQVVGVVGNVKYSSLAAPPGPELYRPFEQAPNANMTLVGATSIPPEFAAGVHRQVRLLDPDLPLGQSQTMDEVLWKSVAQPRFQAWLLTCFGLTALILVVVGIYSVVSYDVSQRVQEVGIRMALGALPQDILKLVLGQALVWTFIGVTIGWVSSLVLTRGIATLFYEVSTTDLPTFAGVAILLMAAASAAVWAPASRACRLDPLLAIRHS